jgi:hypothetical protein
MRSRWTALTRCFEDGRVGLQNNPAERALPSAARITYLPDPMLAVEARRRCTN